VSGALRRWRVRFPSASATWADSAPEGSSGVAPGAVSIASHVSFLHTQFSGSEVDFFGAKFSAGLVTFAGAVFSGGNVSFGYAQFCGADVLFSATGFSGGTVDLSGAANWSHPPRFDWMGTPNRRGQAASSPTSATATAARPRLSTTA
jgi:hypothetical protein